MVNPPKLLRRDSRNETGHSSFLMSNKSDEYKSGSTSTHDQFPPDISGIGSQKPVDLISEAKTEDIIERHNLN